MNEGLLKQAPPATQRRISNTLYVLVIMSKLHTLRQHTIHMHICMHRRARFHILVHVHMHLLILIWALGYMMHSCVRNVGVNSVLNDFESLF